MKISDKKSAEALFKATVRMLAAASLALIEDYPIEEKVRNHKLLTHYMSKTQLQKLRSDVRRAVRYLLALNGESIPDSRELVKWAKAFDAWNQRITQYHIEHHTHQWSYYATALHFMIDSYYHIFKRFVTNSRAIGCNCKWCGFNLASSWGDTLEDVLKNRVPNLYLYTAMAQATNLNIDITELPVTSLEDLRELCRIALTN